MTDTFLSIRQVHKAFGTTVVVQEFNLDVRQGEFVSFLGPSGCGKTTMLRIVAGFEEPSSGSVFIGGKDVTRLKPNQRNIGMVFQAYALFPNMTVAQNIGFGLKVAGMPKAQMQARVGEMLELIKLQEFGGRYPYQLSGGQQQRVALARAMAGKPQVLLLDAKVRVSLREEIRAIQKELGITTIFVTHDQEEALSMSDRIVVMYNGRAEQVGTPFEIYNKPATRFVAGFVGTLNVLEGKVADAEQGIVRIGAEDVATGRALTGRRAGEPISLALRPEAISLGPKDGRASTAHGIIREVSFLGSVIRVRVALGDDVVSLDTFNNPATPPPVAGEKASISFSPEDVHLLDQ